MLTNTGEHLSTVIGDNAGVSAIRREGDQLRGELLRAAAMLAATPRPVAIPSLRAVARACDVSAAAVYRHFPSQSALTRALLATENHALEAALLHDDDPAQAPRQRLRRLGREYVRWGLTHPGMYQLLFESFDQLDADSALGDISDAVMDLTRVLVAALPGISPTEVGLQAERLWSGVHGIVSLRIHKPGHPWLTDAEAEAERLVDHLP